MHASGSESVVHLGNLSTVSEKDTLAMSTKSIPAADRETSVVRGPETFAYSYMHHSPFGLGAHLCGSLAAINATWAGLTNQRLRENFRLPRELASCTSLPAILWAYSNYCQAAILQYQAGLSQFQQIALHLMRDVPVGSFKPAEACGDIQVHVVRSCAPATDDALP